MNNFKFLLFTESERIEELNHSRENQAVKNIQDKICNHLIKSSFKKDISKIINNEKAILMVDLERNANSDAMRNSLNTALNEISVIEKHLKLIENSEEYKKIDNAYSLPKNRKAGLPYDEARQALASHIVRLGNMDKVRLSDNDKKIIKARQGAMKVALDIYKEKQQNALGIGQNQQLKNTSLKL